MQYLQTRPISIWLSGDKEQLTIKVLDRKKDLKYEEEEEGAINIITIIVITIIIIIITITWNTMEERSLSSLSSGSCRRIDLPSSLN